MDIVPVIVYEIRYGTVLYASVICGRLETGFTIKDIIKKNLKISAKVGHPLLTLPLCQSSENIVQVVKTVPTSRRASLLGNPVYVMIGSSWELFLCVEGGGERID